MTLMRRAASRTRMLGVLMVAGALALAATGCGGADAPTSSTSRVANDTSQPSPPGPVPATQIAAGPPAGPSLAGTTAPTPHNNEPVLVVGDSLAEGTMYYLPSILKGHQLTSRYHIGYALRNALPWLEQTASALPPIVVVNLGNNDAPMPSILGPEIRKTLDVLGDRCVIWPTIQARGSYDGYPWASFNQVLHAETATRPNVHVLDWVGVVAKHPEWLASDGIHVSGVGYQTRARLVAAAIDDCR
jgi:hypothetical protein